MATSRSLRLRVYHDGSVVLTAPKRVSERQITEFINDNRAWIEEKLQTATANLESLTANRDQLFFRGQEYRFRLTVSASQKPNVTINGSAVVVTSPAEDHHAVRPILEKWYRRQAEQRFKERVPLLADLVNKEVKTVTIRSQRTRWGSCSSRNTISLNWRLIMAPDEVADYVIYHELAHLTHLDHSKNFWQLVETYCPNYKTAERWLKTHQLIFLYNSPTILHVLQRSRYAFKIPI